MVGPMIVNEIEIVKYIMFCEYASGKEPALTSSKKMMD